MRARDALPLAALVAAAALVRFTTIDVQSFWADEQLSAALVRMPLGRMLDHLPSSELTPPLYYVVGWGWSRLFGYLEVGLRSLSAVCGIGTVAVAYLIGRELVSRRVALVLGALAAFNPLLVWYSQEARPYALLVLLGALSALFFLRALRLRTRGLWLWSLMSILALLTHYFAAFLVVPEALWLVWVWRPRSRALWAAAAIVAVGIALAPLAAKEHEQISSDYITVMSLPRRALGVPEDYLTGFVIKWDLPRETLLDVLAAIVALAGVALAFLRARGAERRALWLGVAGVAAAAGIPALLAAAGVDFLNTRNALLGWLPFALVVAVGFALRRNPTAVAAAGTTALCAIGLAATVVSQADSDYHRSNWRGAARALPPASVPRVLIVPVYVGQIAFGNYLDGLEQLPRGGARVSEVDVLTPRTARLGGVQAHPPADPRLPGPGFRVVERRYDATFTVVRFRAPAPRPVGIPQVLRAGLPLIPSPQPLLQLPSGR